MSRDYDNKDEWVRSGEKGLKGATQSSVYMGDGDRKMLAEIMEKLGTTQSDAIRTSIRIYWAILQKEGRTQ